MGGDLDSGVIRDSPSEAGFFPEVTLSAMVFPSVPNLSAIGFSWDASLSSSRAAIAYAAAATVAAYAASYSSALLNNPRQQRR